MVEFTLTKARPYGFTFPLAKTAVLIIDMQRDFLDPNGFGAEQCGNPEIFTSVRKIVPQVQRVLDRCRKIGIQVIHTREGHRADLLDLPAAKRLRQISAPGGHHNIGIGDRGPMGRLLVRGEYGHSIIDELGPRPEELTIDKPGKGSFWGTTLHRDLLARGITHLLVAGVTTECCVTTTIRECNDRGYECCLLSDCTNGFDAQMVTTAMDTICAQDGLFGYVGHSSDFLEQTASYSLTELTLPDGVLPSISQLVRQYRERKKDPIHVMNMVYDQIEKQRQQNSAAWVYLQRREDVITAAKDLKARYEDKHNLPPLFGVPFGVQDNIDVAGTPTTATFDAYTYTPGVSAQAVQALLHAGAIFIGKLKLNQLGLDPLSGGPRCGITKSLDCPKDVAGGSPSSVPAALGIGLVSFALATDTTGDSLVCGGLNGVMTLKTTKGTISTRGVVPLCPTLDTISVVARTVEDARAVWLYVQKSNDTDEPYAKPFASLPTWHIDARDTSRWKSRFRFAVPPLSLLETVCSKVSLDLFRRAIEILRQCGGTLGEIDYEPLSTASELVAPRDGDSPNTLVDEHIATLGAEFLEKSLPPMLQKMYKHHLSTPSPKPWTIFQAQARLAECARKAQALFNPLNPDGIDILVVPSARACPTPNELQTESAMQVAEFTRAVNALDLCAVGVNAGWVKDRASGGRLPFGVTFLGGMGYDAKVLDLARDFVDASEACRG
ncbi:amidase signature domain-containing protein [Aspergillus pseudoustus]|uniref:Amidase signature domain-containing protein n=1 Tax=Aspergillus pseudoustus TaxID=1810923 RepID=A0ABR4K7U3_9EURO